MKKQTNYWRNGNNPIEEELDKTVIDKYLWVWDTDTAKAKLLFVKNKSHSKSFKYSAYDNNNRFVANFKNAEVVKP